MNGTPIESHHVQMYMKALRDCHSYSPLDETKREIRLLLLHSNKRSNGPRDDTIRCSLHHIPLEDVPSFEALSYVWGEITGIHGIILDGQWFPTTLNLHNALLSLRQDDEDRCIWVDALCIDQANNRERTSQVLEMRFIYQLASTVVVYLGEKGRGCDAAMDALETGAQDETLHWDPSHEKHISVDGMDANSKDLQNYIINFFAAPWWARVWTVQEYCLAQRVDFQYGTRTISTEVVQRCLDNNLKHLTTCCEAFKEFRKAADGTIDSLSVFGVLRRLQTLTPYSKRKGTPFLVVVSDFRLRSCFDPRDKIYGILGLLNPGFRNHIQPDYTRPVKDLYLDVTLLAIEATESLSILGLKYGERTQHLNLPSFVPDWTAHVSEDWYPALQNRWKQTEEYDASKGSAVDLQRSAPGEYEVTTSGVYIDKVKTKVMLDDWKPMLRVCREAANIDNDVSSPYADKATAFWHTMCAGSSWDGPPNEIGFRRVEQKDFSRYQQWLKYIESESPQEMDNNDVFEFQVTFNMAIAVRRFVVTEKGYMGWVPVEVEVGDAVVLLNGGKVPYILGPLGEQKAGDEEGNNAAKEPSGKQKYEFIGDAYIHGVMDGECYDEKKLEVFHLA
jgi:hypothetical protein